MPRAGFVELALAVVAYGKAVVGRKDFQIQIWKIDSEALVFHKAAKAQPARFDVTEGFCAAHPRSAKVLRTLCESSAGVWKIAKIAEAQAQVEGEVQPQVKAKAKAKAKAKGKEAEFLVKDLASASSSCRSLRSVDRPKGMGSQLLK